MLLFGQAFSVGTQYVADPLGVLFDVLGQGFDLLGREGCAFAPIELSGDLVEVAAYT